MAECEKRVDRRVGRDLSDSEFSLRPRWWILFMAFFWRNSAECFAGRLAKKPTRQAVPRSQDHFISSACWPAHDGKSAHWHVTASELGREYSLLAIYPLNNFATSSYLWVLFALV